MLSLPWTNHSFEILIATYYATGEWDIHCNSEWVGPIQASYAFFSNDVLEALCYSQLLAELQSLFHY